MTASFVPEISLNVFEETQKNVSCPLVLVPDGLRVTQNWACVCIYIGQENSETVTVYKNTDSFSRQAEINWAGCGSQKAEYTTRFAEAIKLALDIVANLEVTKSLCASEL